MGGLNPVCAYLAGTMQPYLGELVILFSGLVATWYLSSWDRLPYSYNITNQLITVIWLFVWVVPSLYGIVLRCIGKIPPAPSKDVVEDKQGRFERGFHMTTLFLTLNLLIPARARSNGTPSLVINLLSKTIILAGIIFAFWARISLGEFWRGTPAVRQGHQLIKTGPYRFVRHPIYTGLYILTIGHLVASASIPSALGVIIVWCLYLRKIQVEEHMLSSKFGEEHKRWCSQTHLVIPFIF